MEGKDNPKAGHRFSASFKTGAIALAFLIIGYQVALFVGASARERIVANRDNPDTVFVYVRPEAEESGPGSVESGKDRRTGNPARHATSKEDAVRRSVHSPAADKIYRKVSPRRYESFRFNPNTATVDELMRLGFSEKQALSIDSYRKKGGKFRRSDDFSRSYVVSDTLFERLRPYIDIPLLDLNSADSSAFDALPGIGPYFAAKMVEYRRILHGYSYPEQLMEIRHFDEEKYDSVKDLVTVGEHPPYPLWTLPEDSLRRHPYITDSEARGIVLFRENSPRGEWSVDALSRAGVLVGEDARRLLRCRIASPD